MFFFCLFFNSFIHLFVLIYLFFFHLNPASHPSNPGHLLPFLLELRCQCAASSSSYHRPTNGEHLLEKLLASAAALSLPLTGTGRSWYTYGSGSVAGGRRREIGSKPPDTHTQTHTPAGTCGTRPRHQPAARAMQHLWRRRGGAGAAAAAAKQKTGGRVAL